MEPEQKNSGALIGSIIIIIILIIGGIYLWKTSKGNTLPAGESQSVGSSNSDTADVEANVNSIDVDNIDNGL